MRHTDSHPPAGLPSAAGYRFALIVSRFNPSITGALRDGARMALTDAGVEDDAIDVMEVPGAFELPQAAKYAAATGRFDAVITLGCVIRGATPHFEYISSAVAQGIMDASGQTGVPVAFGVLTTDSPAQAEERAGPGRDNKGWEAAAAAIEMAILFRRLGRKPARTAAAPRPFGFKPAPAGGRD